MSSSTSSFKRKLHSWSRGVVGANVLFVLGFAFALTGGMIVYQQSENLQWANRVIKSYPGRVPEGSFLAHFMGAIEQDVFVHDHYDYYRALKEADVVFVGHSRLMRATDPLVLKSFFKKLGLKYYQLSMGHRDGFPIVVDIFERHNIRPKLLVVSGNLFFESYKSKALLRAEKRSKWESWKMLKEKEIAYPIVRNFHSLVPHINNPAGLFHLVFRDLEFGHWSSPVPREEEYPIILEANRRRYDKDDRVVRNGEKFYWWLKSRGGNMVLTWLPTSKDNLFLGEVDRIAARTGAPMLYVEESGWKTFDRSHLTEKSAKRWSILFLEKLMRRQEFRKLLGR